MYRYKTQGVCSQEMLIELDGNIIKEVQIIGGCRGNTQGVTRLVKGMEAGKAAELLAGIKCKGETSCPDQLSKALIQCMAEQEKNKKEQ